MNLDLTTSLLATRQSATLEVAQMKIMKKQHEMEMSLIEMIDKAVRSPPQPGQGTHVDKSA